MVPSGGPKVRANDTDFRFRPGSDFSWLAGSHEPDAVLVVDAAGEAVLYQAPSWDRSTPAFFTDRGGELWVGPRPSLDAVTAELGITTRPLEEIEKLQGTSARVLRGYDGKVEGLFETVEENDTELETWLSEARLVKDGWEVEQLQKAVDATIKGFEDVARALPQAVATSERWAEGVFGLRARVEGNDVGYGSICAAGAHACTLHWTDNDGPVRRRADPARHGRRGPRALHRRRHPHAAGQRHVHRRVSARSTTWSTARRRRRWPSASRATASSTRTRRP